MIDTTKAGILYALRELAGAIELHKLNVRKDFHLLNAHAYALKVLHHARSKKRAL